MIPATRIPRAEGRSTLARLAELIDAECPSQGWRLPENESSHRIERAAERVARSLRREIDGLALSVESIAIGIDALERGSGR